MDKYINKTKLLETMLDIDMLDKEEIAGLPTEDVAPVTHGKWIETTTRLNLNCSNCNVTIAHIKFKYCPNCGAKMDKE